MLNTTYQLSRARQWHIKAPADLFCLSNLIFPHSGMVLNILLTYFAAEICALILPNWLLYGLYGIPAEETAVIRSPGTVLPL